MRLAGTRIARCACTLFALMAMNQLSATHAQAQQVGAAEERIPESEIEQRTRLWASVPRKSYTREQVIAELRDEKRKIREAKQAGVEVLRAEVDEEYARMARRMDLTVAQLTENLAQEGIGPETVKHRLHADIVWRRYQKGRQQP